MNDTEKININCIVKESLNSHIYGFLSNTISIETAKTFLQETIESKKNNTGNKNNNCCIPLNCELQNNMIQKTNLLEQWQKFWYLLNNTNNTDNNTHLDERSTLRGFNPNITSLQQRSQLDLLPIMATSLENETNISDTNIDTNNIVLQNAIHSHKINNDIPISRKPTSNEIISLPTVEDIKVITKSRSQSNPRSKSQVALSTNDNTIKFENVSFANAIESNFEGSISSHYFPSSIPKVTKKISKPTKSKKSSKFSSPFIGSFQTTGWVKQYADNTTNKLTRKKSNKKNTPTSLESHSRKLEFSTKRENSQRSNSVCSNCSSTTAPSVSSLSSSSKSKPKSKKYNSKSPIANNNNNNHNPKVITTPQVDSLLDSTTIDLTEMTNSNPTINFIQETNNYQHLYAGYQDHASNSDEHSFMETLLHDTLPFDEHIFTAINFDQFSVQSSNSEVGLNSMSHRKSDSSRVSSE
ncbi:hypothetical protein, no similarity [Maudiozyma barnettii]|uniref:Uncharacterized protein n=1 Tax=Maudiozyma barnettii TaxID=61262 RepID=A0A8H2ZFB2_9SACH|nr:hypothetical protein, no similarity [Kazachstania barnettii]CAB4252160.1 hypothetical protein, no similarity [Kazachstania barnettii]CAD1778737.1 hypothetical protein, no similarity [Kazachstania barnettii]